MGFLQWARRELLPQNLRRVPSIPDRRRFLLGMLAGGAALSPAGRMFAQGGRREREEETVEDPETLSPETIEGIRVFGREAPLANLTEIRLVQKQETVRRINEHLLEGRIDQLQANELIELVEKLFGSSSEAGSREDWDRVSQVLHHADRENGWVGGYEIIVNASTYRKYGTKAGSGASEDMPADQRCTAQSFERFWREMLNLSNRKWEKTPFGQINPSSVRIIVVEDELISSDPIPAPIDPTTQIPHSSLQAGEKLDYPPDIGYQLITRSDPLEHSSYAVPMTTAKGDIWVDLGTIHEFLSLGHYGVAEPRVSQGAAARGFTPDESHMFFPPLWDVGIKVIEVAVMTNATTILNGGRENMLSDQRPTPLEQVSIALLRRGKAADLVFPLPDSGVTPPVYISPQVSGVLNDGLQKGSSECILNIYPHGGIEESRMRVNGVDADGFWLPLGSPTTRFIWNVADTGYYTENVPLLTFGPWILPLPVSMLNLVKLAYPDPEASALNQESFTLPITIHTPLDQQWVVDLTSMRGLAGEEVSGVYRIAVESLWEDEYLARLARPFPSTHISSDEGVLIASMSTPISGDLEDMIGLPPGKKTYITWSLRKF